MVSLGWPSGVKIFHTDSDMDTARLSVLHTWSSELLPGVRAWLQLRPTELRFPACTRFSLQDRPYKLVGGLCPLSIIQVDIDNCREATAEHFVKSKQKWIVCTWRSSKDILQLWDCQSVFRRHTVSWACKRERRSTDRSKSVIFALKTMSTAFSSKTGAPSKLRSSLAILLKSLKIGYW